MNHLLKEVILHPQKKNPLDNVWRIQLFHQYFPLFCSVVCFQPYEFTITMFGASTTAVSESAPRSTSVALLRWARWLSLERDSHPVDTTAKGMGWGKLSGLGHQSSRKLKNSETNGIVVEMYYTIKYNMISYHTIQHDMIWYRNNNIKIIYHII